MWIKAWWARYRARLEEMVSLRAVEQVTAWLERVDLPHSENATPCVMA